MEPKNNEDIAIRRLTIDDLATYNRIIQDKRVAEPLGYTNMSNFTISETSFAHQLSETMAFAVVMQGEVIGSVILAPTIGIDMQENDEEVELSYFIDPKWWENGFAKVALKKVFLILRDKTKIKSVISSVFENNFRSIGLLSDLGFEKNGHYLNQFTGKNEIQFKLRFNRV
ncbi:GNAT family protein [Lentilactobacillus sp. Marseille-Q4993]|uniref:GNAT family N-acetyltransferase n=1 Tax=Lentilactobacillus sp. Marseille-Q4993 TaxID=3039492 RepID=UPI0024BC4551|nr:GNAT family protein [Lentilactobacillus sp. Marseille-Q4993]